MFTGSTGDNVVVTIAQDGTWPPPTGPEALFFEPGNATPLRAIQDSWAFTLFNSSQDPGLGVGLAQAFSSIMAGSAPFGQTRYLAFIGDIGAVDPVTGPGGVLDLAFGVTTPLVPLVNDGAPNEDPDVPLQNVPGGLDRVQSTEQEVLLGCGDYYFSDCDGAVHEGPDGVLGTPDDTEIGGVELANTDASVLLQSFPPFDGSEFDPDWDTADATLPQPGTVDAAFHDGPGGGADLPGSVPGEPETGLVGGDVPPGAHADAAAFVGVLANAAANGIDVDDGVEANLATYDVAVDGSVGCTTPGDCRRHPFTGQNFSSEMAIASWNLLMLAVALGAQDAAPSPALLDRAQPLALGRCSFRQPQYCTFVSGLATHLSQGGRVTLPSDGTYTILVRANDPRATGPYVLELTCPTACANDTDDDGDGLIDLTDPGCVSASDQSEFNPPAALWQCALGPELLAVIPLLAAARRRSASKTNEPQRS
jgi:hypothetical protein